MTHLPEHNRSTCRGEDSCQSSAFRRGTDDLRPRCCLRTVYRKERDHSLRDAFHFSAADEH